MFGSVFGYVIRLRYCDFLLDSVIRINSMIFVISFIYMLVL